MYLFPFLIFGKYNFSTRLWNQWNSQQKRDFCFKNKFAELFFCAAKNQKKNKQTKNEGKNEGKNSEVKIVDKRKKKRDGRRHNIGIFLSPNLDSIRWSFVSTMFNKHSGNMCTFFETEITGGQNTIQPEIGENKPSARYPMFHFQFYRCFRRYVFEHLSKIRCRHVGFVEVFACPHFKENQICKRVFSNGLCKWILSNCCHFSI